MSVCKMKTLSILCRADQLDGMLRACVESHQFHPETTSAVVTGVTGFVNTNEENPYRAPLQQLTELLDALGLAPEDARETPESNEDDDAFLAQTQQRLMTISQEKARLQKEIATVKENLSELAHFRELDVDFEKALSCRFVSVRFGRLPRESYERLAQYGKRTLLFVPCSLDGDFYWGVYVCPHDQRESVDRIFASLLFERLRPSATTGTPAAAYAAAQEELKAKQDALAALEAQAQQILTDDHDRILGVYTRLKHKSEAFDLRRYCARYKDDYMLLIGWVPAWALDKVEERIRRAAPDAELSAGDPESMSKLTPPSELHNPKIFRPFEMYVQMYGLPAYDEPDPTPFLAITYTLLFGIMFADLGQGLLLMLVGWVMWKWKHMGLGKILLPCGAASALFGAVFGSVFGLEDVLDPLYHVLGFAEKPINVIESAVWLLVGAVGIGVVLLLIAMVLNVIASGRRKDFASALFGPNGVAGILLYGGLILLLLNALLGLGIPGALLGWGMAVCVVLIFLREPLGNLVARRRPFGPASWGDYALESGAELFEVLISYFSNTVSFVRVGAFVLIHAGMMLMFTNLAEALGNPVGYVIMMVFGNLFVTVLEALLVSIQTLRLEFYEMFSRFYRGDGREYTPISAAPTED